MITKKVFFILILAAIFISTSISLFFSHIFLNKLDIKSENLVNNINLNKNSTTVELLSNLKGVNPLSRRESIVSLGESKNTEAIMPLFSLLMETTTTDIEVELISSALYNITNGKIIGYIVQLLSINYGNTTSKDNLFKEKLTPKQTVNLLHILMQMTQEQQNKDKYNLDFLSNLLKVKNNDLLLTTLNCIAALSYEPLYYQVQELYSQSLFIKIPVIQTITRIALHYEKYQQNAENFILKQILQETHPNVQEENYLALYMLTQHLLELPVAIETLAKKIVGLNSNLFEVSLQQEKTLLENPFEREHISLVKFFLSDFISVRLKSRLLNILLVQKDIAFLDKTWLLKNIQRRNMDTIDDTSNSDLAKISLKILAQNAQNKEDIRTIISYLTEKKITYTVISILNKIVLVNNLKSFIEELLPNIKSIIYVDSSLIPWFSYFVYQLKGFEELPRIINTQSEKSQMNILHEIAGCKILLEDRKKLVDIYGSKTQSTFFQSILDNVTTGYNTCYFG